MDQKDQPNIVFVVADNVGWGDFECYGGVVPTPRTNSLSSEGVQLNNYNVEAQCTPTRAALLTGRIPIRSGTLAVPLPGQGPYGLSSWEYTMADLLSDAGYHTALYGKWHEGEVDGRLPTDQGFDYWWGIKNTTDEAGYASYPAFSRTGRETPKIWEGHKGEPSDPVHEFDAAIRPYLDEQIVQHANAFIERSAGTGRPFFAYIGLTQLHPPFDVHPHFKGASGGGSYSDNIVEMDQRLGQVLDVIEHAGVSENTIVVFSSDNGALKIGAMGGGSSGPWRGHFMTPPYEGSHRVPAIVRWPAKIPSGVVTNELFAAVDWLPTIARLIDKPNLVPNDRPIDGVDSSALLLGASNEANRDAFSFYGPDSSLMSVKWGTYKVIFRYSEGMALPIVSPQWPLVYDLVNDPHEDWNMMDSKLDMFWIFDPVYRVINEQKESMRMFRNIQPGEEFTGYG